jgi:hypothetical protein
MQSGVDVTNVYTGNNVGTGDMSLLPVTLYSHS